LACRRQNGPGPWGAVCPDNERLLKILLDTAKIRRSFLRQLSRKLWAFIPLWLVNPRRFDFRTEPGYFTVAKLSSRSFQVPCRFSDNLTDPAHKAALLRTAVRDQYSDLVSIFRFRPLTGYISLFCTFSSLASDVLLNSSEEGGVVRKIGDTLHIREAVLLRDLQVLLPAGLGSKQAE
jgi:hypothetical protein